MSKNTRTVKFENGIHQVILEVNPASMSIQYPQLSTKTQLVGGEYIRMGEKGLRTTSLTTFIPHDKSSFKTSRMSQKEIIDTLYAWKINKQPVTVTATGFTSGTFYITSLGKTVKEGDRDVEVQISLTECRNISSKRPSSNTSSTSGGSGSKKSKKYTVVKGDNLSKISKNFMELLLNGEIFTTPTRASSKTRTSSILVKS